MIYVFDALGLGQFCFTPQHCSALSVGDFDVRSMLCFARAIVQPYQFDAFIFMNFTMHTCGETIIQIWSVCELSFALRRKSNSSAISVLRFEVSWVLLYVARLKSRFSAKRFDGLKDIRVQGLSEAIQSTCIIQLEKVGQCIQKLLQFYPIRSRIALEI